MPSTFFKFRLYFPIALFTFFNAAVSAQVFYEGPGWTDIGTLTYTAFGWSMSDIGDVNGDGFHDMVVTAIDYSNPPETNGEEGEALVYYGSADGLSAEPDWQFESNNDSSVMGFSSDGGDLNGDGFSDLVLGWLQWTGDQYNEGLVAVWYGSPTGLSSVDPDWIFELDQANALLGSGVAMSGDINSDGYNDLFISAKMWDEPEEDEGKTWLFWGSPDGPVESGWSWEANQAGSISGFPVNYAGDVNADGYDDVIIGANQYDSIDIDDGLAVAFYGSASGLQATPDWTMSSGQKKSDFGHWVDGAGDVNGDGYDDVIVSALLYENDSAEISEGRLFVYNGGPDGISHTLNWYGEINQSGANLGYSCAGAGDINGDGYDDVIGGAKYWTNGEFTEGGAFVWFGSKNGLQSNYCWTGEGNEEAAYYGRHVGGNADFNGDGYSDFMVGAYRYTTILEADGKGFVYYGAPLQSQFHYEQDTFCLLGENPLPVIDGTAGGYFYSVDAVVDSLTGEIDLLASGGGNKSIHHYNEGLCPDYEFDIYIQDTVGTADIFYYADDIFCSSETDPIPIITTGISGTFYSDAIVDSESGAVDLSATGAGGPFAINLNATTAAGCSVTAVDSITIAYDATFYYLQDTFCIHQMNPYPFVDDVGMGNFYTYDAGLEVNNMNGKLVLNVSVVGGPYTVYYNSNDACPLDSFDVWLKDTGPADNTFHYEEDTFCINEMDPLPVIDVPGVDGIFYSSTAVVNMYGKINLSMTPTGVVHQVYFEADENCTIDSFAVVVMDVDSMISWFHYPDDSVCTNEIDPLPMIDGVSGGYFYSYDATIDSLTGAIDLAATGAGMATIYYSINDLSGCTLESSFDVYLFNDAVATFMYPDSVFFQDESNPHTMAFDTSGIFSSSPEGLVFADADGTIDLAASLVGTYMIYYTVSGAICTITDSLQIQILPPCTAPDELTIEEFNSTTITLSWTSDPYYTDYFVYLVSPEDTIIVNVENDTVAFIDSLDPGTTYFIFVYTDCIADTSGYVREDVTLPDFINQLGGNFNIQVYPNPVDDVLNIEVEINLSPGQNMKLELINSSGEIVISADVTSTTSVSNIQMDTSKLPPGIYLLKYSAGGNCWITQIVRTN